MVKTTDVDAGERGGGFTVTGEQNPKALSKISFEHRELRALLCYTLFSTTLTLPKFTRTLKLQTRLVGSVQKGGSGTDSEVRLLRFKFCVTLSQSFTS